MRKPLFVGVRSLTWSHCIADEPWVLLLKSGRACQGTFPVEIIFLDELEVGGLSKRRPCVVIASPECSMAERCCEPLNLPEL